MCKGTHNLIAAARSARIGRLYYLSQLGAEPSSAYYLLRVKGQVEALIRNSGIAYTILRCGVDFWPGRSLRERRCHAAADQSDLFFAAGAGRRACFTRSM